MPVSMHVPTSDPRRCGSTFRLCRPARVAAMLFLTIFAWMATAPVVQAEDTIEQYLPDANQRQPLNFEALKQNNNAVFVGTVTETAGANRVFNVKVVEVFKGGDSGRTVKADDEINVQCYRANPLKDETYIFPIYLWGNNNPGVCNIEPIKLRRDYQNDPLYKVLKFTVSNTQASTADGFTQQAWKLYSELPQTDFLTDGRLDLLTFIATDRADRFDPKHEAFAAEIDRVLHTELTGNADRLKAIETGDANARYRMERALNALTKLYAMRENLKAGDELSRLLKTSPMAISAAYALVERCSPEETAQVAEALLPLVEAQLKDKQVNRRAVQVYYLARLAKSDKIIDMLKKAVTDDDKRPDVLLICRTLVAVQGEDCWSTVSPVLSRQFDWQNANIYAQSDLIKMSIEKIGKKCYPDLVSAIKKNPQLQNMIYQVYNGLGPTQKEDFGFEMIEAGVHNALPFMLQGTASPTTRLMELVLRYAVGEVQATDDNDRNMMINATNTARQYLKNRLGCDCNTRAEFNAWYIDRLANVQLPLSDKLKAKLPDWQRDLGSPVGETRMQAQKELSNLGSEAMPVLLQLEHTAKDLTTRQTARALLLQQPLIAEAFSSDP